MLFPQFPIWIDLEAPLLSVRSDDDFVVPLAIGVVFPFYPNDLTSSRLLVNCLLDGGGERLHLDHFPGLLSYLRGRATSETGADHRCKQSAFCFHTCLFVASLSGGRPQKFVLPNITLL